MYSNKINAVLCSSKTLTLCLILLIISFKLQAQKRHFFGKGKIIVTWYIFPDSTLRDTTGHSWNRFTFYINDNLILRKEDDIDIPTEQINEKRNAVSAKMETPTYLIDFDYKRVVEKKHNSTSDELNTYELDTYTYDLFYRSYLKKHRSHFQELDTLSDELTDISGFKCYFGIAKVDGQISRFAYTKEKMQVDSPLNGLLPKFPYQIIWYQTKNVASDNNSDTRSEFYITNISKGLNKNDIMKLLK